MYRIFRGYRPGKSMEKVFDFQDSAAARYQEERQMILKNDTGEIRSPVIPATGDRLIEYRGVSVLLVFSSPVEMIRMCRQLEEEGMIAADTCVSDEDAIHLLNYIRFDIIITEYFTQRSDKNWFLKSMRSRSLVTPVVYYSSVRDRGTEEEAKKYGPVYFIYGNTSLPEPADLYPVIMQAVMGPLPQKPPCLSKIPGNAGPDPV